MRLSDEERSMLAGEMGAARRQALQHQLKVGDFFGAEDLVPVTQAHVMADSESFGEARRTVSTIASMSSSSPDRSSACSSFASLPHCARENASWFRSSP